MSALLRVKNHASVSQQKVFWKNQTFPSLSRSVKLDMTILIVLALEADMAIVRLLRLPGRKKWEHLRLNWMV